jgi:uncharacterized protein (DUF58 family)
MLDPVVLASVADLEMVARVVVDGTVAGLHRSPFHGYSAEFSQYRHYRPGDDLKYVDWKLYARTDRFYTKQYRETTNLLAGIAMDASGSMSYRGDHGVTKLEYARMLAAALSYVIAQQGDGVGLVVYDDRIRHFIPSRTGQSHLRKVFTTLAGVVPSGRTAAAPAVRQAAELLKRRGLLIVLSDLYDEDAAIEGELRRAIRMGHEVAVFHILTRAELEFPAGVHLELEDLESGATIVADAAGLRAGYRERLQAFVDGWRERCTRHGIDYVTVVTDMPLDHALRGYLLKRASSPAR